MKADHRDRRGRQGPDPLGQLPRARPAGDEGGLRKAEPVEEAPALRAAPVRRSLQGAVDRKTAQLVEIRGLMKKAARFTLDDPCRRGATYFLPAVGDVIFTGDLHGHKENLAKLVDIAALHRYPERHIVLHEATHNIQFGLIDRDISFRSIERLAEFKCEFPDRVHIVMGNHELAEYLGKKIVKDGHLLNQMFAQGLKSQYGDAAGDVKQAYNIFFKSQALAVRCPNGIFMSHSIPPGKVIAKWDPSILAAEGAVTDVIDIPQIEWLVWGRDYSQENADRFAAMVGAEILLCGHEACKKGYKVPNSRQIILDSKDEEGVFLHIRLDRKYTLDELVRNIYKINEPLPEV